MHIKVTTNKNIVGSNHIKHNYVTIIAGQKHCKTWVNEFYILPIINIHKSILLDNMVISIRMQYQIKSNALIPIDGNLIPMIV